ncbi:TPA: hypothetical protein ACU967_002270 [Burkholderia contaminans]|uniref:hypothetical protein n=1 Tax=Burkholderia contaminans TaxID=488447 RepID=UPI000D00682C|nr:hypothetical protein [Burkholderia contaminans]HDR9065512.1 hypothetical protein [Burkholderia vietnamiensis]MBM6427951.1 hypothetical protein [Burkholderia contaminans]MCA7876782.1 hypothetical protein [Burkholderia contaminans]MDN8024195.1 hypothetical protein [Burkholderia contaminans]PRG12194.1 hypothetical protein C6Q17_14140 [Burkholderia contaminans]
MENQETRIKQIRRENFLFLFEQFKERVRQTLPSEKDRGMLKRFSEQLGISDKFVSHINTGRKPIGDRAAQKIEEALSLPRGWMDETHAEEAIDALSPLKQEVVAMVVELLKSGSEEGAAEVMRLVREKMTGQKNGG